MVSGWLGVSTRQAQGGKLPGVHLHFGHQAEHVGEVGILQRLALAGGYWSRHDSIAVVRGGKGMIHAFLLLAPFPHRPLAESMLGMSAKLRIGILFLINGRLCSLSLGRGLDEYSWKWSKSNIRKEAYAAVSIAGYSQIV